MGASDLQISPSVIRECGERERECGVFSLKHKQPLGSPVWTARRALRPASLRRASSPRPKPTPCLGALRTLPCKEIGEHQRSPGGGPFQRLPFGTTVPHSSSADGLAKTIPLQIHWEWFITPLHKQGDRPHEVHTHHLWPQAISSEPPLSTHVVRSSDGLPLRPSAEPTATWHRKGQRATRSIFSTKSSLLAQNHHV